MPRDETSQPVRPVTAGVSVRLIDVGRRWGVTAALRRVSIDIAPGTLTVLLGPSGCGKTTCLRIVAGLETATEGRVEIAGRDVTDLPPAERGVAMVFQSYALFPHLNVAENIVFGLRARRVPAPERARRLARAAELLGIGHLLERKPGQLSGGQQQRVAIARAIVIEPPLVLMDEPLSNLDAKLRLETRAEIRRIHRELGRSTIYVTHDQDEALSLADRIVVMKDGVVQQIATPLEVYAQPANLHVARFMGYRNVFELDVEGEEGDRVRLGGPGMRLTGTRKLPLSGRQATVAIRPEEVLLGEGPGGQNTIEGKVDNVEYCGRDSLIDLVTASGTLVHVRSAGVAQRGDTVRVHVPVERALIYPRD